MANEMRIEGGAFKIMELPVFVNKMRFEGVAFKIMELPVFILFLLLLETNELKFKFLSVF